MNEKTTNIITATKAVIDDFPNMKLTLRQIYYQLVGKAIIENNINTYKRLSEILVTARKAGLVPNDIFEDKTRSIDVILDQEIETPEERVESLLSYLQTTTLKVSLSANQPVCHIIGLEKQALETFFRSCIPDTANVIFVVCRGYNSFTQLYELTETLNRISHERLVCSYFGDYDPTGLDIPRNFKDQMGELGFPFSEFERVAITQEDIERFNLPTAPAKSKDSRSKTWEGGGCVELDALSPAYLQQLIKQRVELYWDHEKEQEILQKQTEQNTQFRTLLGQALKQFQDW